MMASQQTPGSGSAPAAEQLAPQSPGRKLPAMVRAMRHRNFQLFFSGQLISLIGTWMQNVAQAWLVYRMTGSSLLLGAVAFANQIPVFLFAPLGGIVADRHNRQRVVIATQSAMMLLAFALAVLTLTHTVKVWHIFVLAALLGVANSYDIPARQSFLVDMVGKEDLMNAIALNSSMFNGARVVGPAVAGILVAWVGEGWCFLGNAVSYIAVIAGLLLMKLPPWVKPDHPDSALEHMVEGFRFVRRTMPIRALLLLLGLVSLVGMPYAVLMPIFADQILHGGARALGLLMGAAGVGALIGALTLAAKTQLRGLGTWVAVASLGFGAGLILFAYSRWFWVSLLVLVPVGGALMVQMASSNTLIQAMVPDQLRGRVMAVYTMMFLGMAPLGALLAGALAERLGAPLTLALGGVVCMLGAGAFWRHLPSIRVEARQMIVAQGLAGGDPAEEISTTRSVS
ncbi:MAG TPA: MFS transporter [Terriglobales bacterium]|jgi:MFS family permease|nr:MFS transporter [Terriglobales bacterium]